MTEHHDTTLNVGGVAKIPFTQWISITALIVTIAFNMSTKFSVTDRTAVDLARVETDLVEMRKQMANREDVREMQKVVERLEIQVATLSDRVERQK